MEKDLYAQILDEFPSEAIIQIFSFIEYIEEAIVTYFGNIINKIKEKKVKEETNCLLIIVNSSFLTYCGSSINL